MGPRRRPSLTRPRSWRTVPGRGREAVTVAKPETTEKARGGLEGRRRPSRLRVRPQGLPPSSPEQLPASLSAPSPTTRQGLALGSPAQVGRSRNPALRVSPALPGTGTLGLPLRPSFLSASPRRRLPLPIEARSLSTHRCFPGGRVTSAGQRWDSAGRRARREAMRPVNLRVERLPRHPSVSSNAEF